MGVDWMGVDWMVKHDINPHSLLALQPQVLEKGVKNSPREAHSPTEKKHAGNRFLASGLGVDKLRAQSNHSNSRLLTPHYACCIKL